MPNWKFLRRPPRRQLMTENLMCFWPKRDQVEDGLSVHTYLLSFSRLLGFVTDDRVFVLTMAWLMLPSLLLLDAIIVLHRVVRKRHFKCINQRIPNAEHYPSWLSQYVSRISDIVWHTTRYPQIETHHRVKRDSIPYKSWNVPTPVGCFVKTRKLIWYPRKDNKSK